jgi:hypothetical protein
MLPQSVAQELAPVIADLVQATADVFVQAIVDMLAPKLALSTNCCLLGDSGCVLRPHTAAGAVGGAGDTCAQDVAQSWKCQLAN